MIDFQNAGKKVFCLCHVKLDLFGFCLISSLARFTRLYFTKSNQNGEGGKQVNINFEFQIKILIYSIGLSALAQQFYRLSDKPNPKVAPSRKGLFIAVYTYTKMNLHRRPNCENEGRKVQGEYVHCYQYYYCCGGASTTITQTR